MLKKLIPLALVGLLGGCAAYQEALSLQNSLQTFLVRSITMTAAGSEQCKVALIWGGTTALSSLKKNGTELNSVDKTKNFGEDSVTADGSTYTYTAVFGTGTSAKTIERPIQPYTVGDAGKVEATSPNATLAELPTGGPTVSRTGLTFKWKVLNDAKPSGFMVTVGEAADLSNPTAITPVYNAFLEAASHSVDASAGTYEVAYGTASDLSLLTKEITDLMGQMDPRFAKKDANVTPLDPAKQYVWIIAPLRIDEKAIRFAVGESDFSPFKVSQ